MISTKLNDLIIKKTTEKNYKDVKENIEAMLSPESELPLDEDSLFDALKGDGEFFLLKARYEDFNLNEANTLLDLKLKEALCVTIFFEDDGAEYEKIEAFVQYIFEHTMPQQRFCFGIKRVKELSEYPVRILLSEIYPINQLQIRMGKWIDSFIQLDEAYFKEHFTYVRAKISKEIGITLLPLDIVVDEELCPRDVVLVDSITKEKIVAFSVEEDEDKKALDIYLLKLYYVFLKLGAKYKH